MLDEPVFSSRHNEVHFRLCDAVADEQSLKLARSKVDSSVEHSLEKLGKKGCISGFCFVIGTHRPRMEEESDHRADAVDGHRYSSLLKECFHFLIQQRCHTVQPFVQFGISLEQLEHGLSSRHRNRVSA